MALTGKTIGELSLLQFPTNDTLLPAEYIGDTYHIAFSSITYNEGTYSQFVAEANNSLLTPGRAYLMSDYQAIYDQPNYDNNRSPILSGNSMTGETEPLLLLAISPSEFSPTVYSMSHPQDKITYDINWIATEISNTPAKGRITERIDSYNNRTDYDHRNILFIRYRGYSYNENNPFTGLVGISGITGTTGVLYGDTGTTFNSILFEGSLIAVSSLSPWLFEVISVQSDSIAIISGVTISEISNSAFFEVNDDGMMSYYQPNVRENEGYNYTTFGDALEDNGAVNNYIGNYSNLYLYENVGNFLLANNVFFTGVFRNNTIGNQSYNNTFNDDCDNNQIGDNFYNNSTNDDFDGNIIGEGFRNNYITANFNNNRIGSDFNNNILIGSNFYRNNIGNSFNNNVCTSNDFQNNEIGNQFQNNKIYNNFYKNDIGNGYNNNDIYIEFYGNLIGNGWNNNNIYGYFQDNVVGDYFNNNTIGDSTNIGGMTFELNRIGFNFSNNDIENDFRENDILYDFYQNTIHSALGNRIGNNFGINNIGESFNHNTINDNFNVNTIGNNFEWNVINTSINNIDFTEFYGNITAFTYSAPGSTSSDGSYNSIFCATQTSGNGVGASFTYDVSSGVVNNVNLSTSGKTYNIGDTITIPGSCQGGTDGVDDITITITGVSQTPSVYETYTCQIFERQGGAKRLSYYDSSDVLTIKNINE